MAKISPILLLGAGALAVVALSSKKKKSVGRLDVDPVIQVYQINLTVLGYYSGDMDGKMNDTFKGAIANFQTDAGIPTTGILDSKTREDIVTAVKLKALMTQAANVAKAYGAGVMSALERLFG